MFPRFLVGLVGSGFAAVSLAASGASRVATKIEVGPNSLAAAGVLGSGPGPASPRIEAGPNILVSRGGAKLV